MVITITLRIRKHADLFISSGQAVQDNTGYRQRINYRNKGLVKLIELINDNCVDKVVILYEDRLLRFGFELVEEIANLHNCEIEIIDYVEKTEQQQNTRLSDYELRRRFTELAMSTRISIRQAE